MEKIERSTYTYRTDEHKILILVEDSGHGYKFYKKLLKSVYKDIDFYIESTHGSKNRLKFAYYLKISLLLKTEE